MEERDWKDPVVDTPKQSSDRRWKVVFIGGLNLLTGIILYAVINFSGIPIELIPGLFMCIGGSFIIVGSYMSYKERLV